MSEAISLIDCSPLVREASGERDACDREIAHAATEVGFMVLTHVPEALYFHAERRSALLRVFDLPEDARQGLYRKRYAEQNPNRYRGLAPICPEDRLGKEVFDIGPDAVDSRGRGNPRDLLCEQTPWPDESRIAGWRSAVSQAYAAFEDLGKAVLASLERSWRLRPGRLCDAFADANSTLRFSRHPGPGELPARDREALTLDSEGGEPRLQLVLPHTDSGFLTFVDQDAGAGLEARLRDGTWSAVPTPPESLAVNFGDLLEKWSGGGVKATEHRVVGTERCRTGVIFFFEPGVDAWIEPLEGVPGFEPLHYGDHVFERMQRFPEFQNLGERFAPGT